MIVSHSLHTLTELIALPKMLTFVILSITIQIFKVSATLESPVDLSYAFDTNTLYWNLNSTFNLTPLLRQETPFWFANNAFSAEEHGGTHLDAPYHFNKNGWKVGDIPLERFLVQGVMVDMSQKIGNNPDFLLTEEHLIEWEKNNGPLPNPVVVLVNFDWAKKYPNRTAYFGSSNESTKHFPGISEGAATWMVKSGKVVGVGVDTPSIDAGMNTEFKSHQVLNGANMYLMENVAMANRRLPARYFQLAIMPMKIADGTGAPLRIIAFPNTGIQAFYDKVNGWFHTLVNKIKAMF